MSSAMKAAALTLLIVIIGFGLMSFLGDGPEGPGDNGSGVGSSNSSTTNPVTPVNRLPERQVLKSSISGLVRDEGGTPLPGTTVKMLRLDGGNGVASAVFVSEKKVAADGTFRFDDLAAGLFRFQAALSGYQSHKLDVSLIDGESPPEVVLILTSGMSISGTVYDPLGQPVPNAQIAAFKERVAREAPLQKRLQVLLEL
ncbi:MAG TPA: carboxypeptidase regulatory-like domain-containing protein, partial [Planctomycetes bacterium]|nr:carboxypeptidase regulatory-like domain-containing protein [Planctomycetota bacterium]